MSKSFWTLLVSDSLPKFHKHFALRVFKLTMSKLILENKGVLAPSMADHPTADKKWWAATAGAAAVAHATASAASLQPFQASCRQTFPPSKQPQIKYTDMCVPLSRKVFSLVLESFCSVEFWCYKC